MKNYFILFLVTLFRLICNSPFPFYSISCRHHEHYSVDRHQYQLSTYISMKGNGGRAHLKWIIHPHAFPFLFLTTVVFFPLFLSSPLPRIYHDDETWKYIHIWGIKVCLHLWFLFNCYFLPCWHRLSAIRKYGYKNFRMWSRQIVSSSGMWAGLKPETKFRPGRFPFNVYGFVAPFGLP